MLRAHTGVPPRHCLCQRVSSHPGTVQCGGSKAWTHFKTTLKSQFSSRAFHRGGRGHLLWLPQSLPSPAAFAPSQVSSSINCPAHAFLRVPARTTFEQSDTCLDPPTAAGSSHSPGSANVGHTSDASCSHPRGVSWELTHHHTSSSHLIITPRHQQSL